MKQINLDMDGTFVDLYDVDNWLNKLIAKDASPYEEAKPLVNLSSLARVLNNLQKKGYRICVISWLAKNSTKEYNERVTIAKKNWLKKHLKSVHFDDIKIVPYGTPKNTCGTGILFDDEKTNRNEWQGIAFNVNNLVADLREFPQVCLISWGRRAKILTMSIVKVHKILFLILYIFTIEKIKKFVYNVVTKLRER